MCNVENIKEGCCPGVSDVNTGFHLRKVRI